MVDTDGIFIDYYAPEGSKLFLPESDIIGASLFDIFPEKQAEEHLKAYQTCLDTGEIQIVNYQNEFNGETSYFEARITKLNDHQVLAIIRDTTLFYTLEKEIQEKITFQNLIMELSTDFINSSMENPDAIIMDALKKIGLFTQVDRVYIFDYQFNEGIMCNTFEWCAEGIEPQIQNLQAIPMSEIPEWVSTHKQGKEILIREVSDLPEKDHVRKILEPQGVRSLLAIPLMNKQKCFGFVGYDSVIKSREWTEFERNLLKIFSEFITNVLLKARMLQNLKKSEEQIRLLAENASDIIALLDKNLNVLYLSPSFKKVTGYDHEFLENHSYFDLIHPDDSEKFWKDFKKLREQKTKTSIFTYRIFHKRGDIIWIESIFNQKVNKEGNLTQVIVISRDITLRKKDEERLKKSLQEKDILLKELHHRVKNNLNVVSSLLNIQARMIKNKEDAIEAFKNSSNRVMTMALIHQKLYQSENFDEINITTFIQSIISHLKATVKAGENIKIETNIKNISMNINLAVPFGLILNELLTNALKHAYPPQTQGIVRIDINKTASGICEITISDDGIGLPQNFNIRKITTLGFHLVNILVHQLNGEWNVEGHKGTSIHIHFPIT